MRIIVDEDLPKAVAVLLTERGHQAEHVADSNLRGASDAQVLAEAIGRGAMLFTADMGFSDVRLFPPGSHKGIVVFRFPDHFRRREIVRLIENFLDSADLTTLQDALVVVGTQAYRIRR